MKYKCFEDLPVWQLARRYAGQIYKLTSKDSFQKDFDLVRQLRRASVSILLNVSEGFERRTNIDFARFINLAKSSAGECKAIIYVSYDLNYIDKDVLEKNIEILKSLSNQLGALQKYLIQTSNR